MFFSLQHTVMNIQNDVQKILNELKNAQISADKKTLEEVLQVCKGYEDLMWSAKIISIILKCDFRDAKQVLEKHYKGANK